MRFALVVGPVVILAVLGAANACSGESSPVGASGEAEGGAAEGQAPSPRDGGGDAAESQDAADAGQDAEDPGTIATEVEPNNGTSATDLGVMTLPGTMKGAIDPASDLDVFSVKLAPGDFWEWTATPSTQDLAPHITVFDTAPKNLNPTVIGFAGAGTPAKLQHFVLRDGTFAAVMRDARNVGAAGNKGGPTYGYALVAKRATPQPTAVSFPSIKTGKLASLGAVALYTFTGTGGKGWDIVVRAQRKAPSSTLDARLSLFDLTAKKAVITNDNGPSSTDPEIGSADPAPSTYMVIVENEGKNDADLSFEIELKLRP